MCRLKCSREVARPGRFLAGAGPALYGAMLTRRYMRTIRRVISHFLRMPFAYRIKEDNASITGTSAGGPALGAAAGRRQPDTGPGTQGRSIRTEAGSFSGLAPDRAAGIARPPGQAVARPGAFFALAGPAAGESS